jgi:hypothetical protein
VLPEPGPGSAPVPGAGSAVLDERGRMRQQMRREQSIISRTRAEGFDD